MHGRAAAFISLTASLIGTIAAPPARAQESDEEAREVGIVLLLTDLTEINGAEQSFEADVFMMATWHAPELAGVYDEPRTLALNDVWHPTLLIYNQRSLSQSMPDAVMVRPDGTATYLQRYTGAFSAPMDLRDFPRDRQEFFVWVVAPTRSGAKVTLVPDKSLVALRAEDLSISDWRIGDTDLTMEALQVAPGAQLNPGVKLSFEASRRQTYYIIQVLIPLVAIVMMSYVVFWMAPTELGIRVRLPVTTMLTLIAYRFMLANHVPRLPYLTRLDWFMLGATVLVILALFIMVGTSYLMNHEKAAAVDRIDRAGRLLFPIVFGAYTLIVWLG